MTRTVITVKADYSSIESVRDLLDPWIKHWSGDEWGESMRDLHGACHTSHGFTDEDCALFATRLLDNVIALHDQVDGGDLEGYGMYEQVDVEKIQKECRSIREYWAKGGNLTNFQPAITNAQEQLLKMPKWMFGEEEDVTAT